MMIRKFKHKTTGFNVEFREGVNIVFFGTSQEGVKNIPVDLFLGEDWEELFDPEFTVKDVLRLVNNWSISKVDEEDIRKFLD